MLNLNGELIVSCPTLNCDTITQPLNENFVIHSEGLQNSCVHLQCPKCSIFVFPCENCFSLVKEIPKEGLDERKLNFIACNFCGFLNIYNKSIRELLGLPLVLSPVPYDIARIIQKTIGTEKYIEGITEKLNKLRVAQQGNNNKIKESPVITNTQWDAGVIELTPIHTANRLNRPVNLPDRNLNSEAFRYQSQLQILSDPIIQQEDLKKMESIQEISSIEYLTNFPIFTLTHWKMLQSLYDENDRTELEVLQGANQFLKESAYLLNIKSETDIAKKVCLRSFRLQFPETPQSATINTHTITLNILYDKFLRLRNIFEYRVKKYFLLLNEINCILRDLYETILPNVSDYLTPTPGTQIYQQRSLSQNQMILELSFKRSQVQQKINLWRSLYRSVSLLIT